MALGLLSPLGPGIGIGYLIGTRGREGLGRGGEGRRGEGRSKWAGLIIIIIVNEYYYGPTVVQ